MRLFVSEFAEKKQEIERMLSGHSSEIIEHILKIIIFPNHISVKHWKKEIWNNLHKIDSLKGSHKRPTAKQIFDWTYNKHKEWIEDKNYLKGFYDSIDWEYEDTPEITLNDLYKHSTNIIKDYFDWISYKLSVGDSVSVWDVSDEIDYLIKKYF